MQDLASGVVKFPSSQPPFMQFSRTRSEPVEAFLSIALTWCASPHEISQGLHSLPASARVRDVERIRKPYMNSVSFPWKWTVFVGLACSATHDSLVTLPVPSLSFSWRIECYHPWYYLDENRVWCFAACIPILNSWRAFRACSPEDEGRCRQAQSTRSSVLGKGRQGAGKANLGHGT